MSEELKQSCKWCGALSTGRLDHHTYPSNVTTYWVTCINSECSGMTPMFETQEDAIKSWNEPTEEQMLRAELADLRADRDSESRWAAQYLSERDEARAEVDKLRIQYDLAYELAMDEREGGKKARAEVERLRGIIRKVEWCVIAFTPRASPVLCPACQKSIAEGHDESCILYQWEGGAQC